MSDTNNSDNRTLPKKVKRNVTFLDYLCYRLLAFVITAILISCTVYFFGPEDQTKNVSLIIIQNVILLAAGIVFAIMECSYSMEITRYEKEKESVSKEWEMQTISSEHNHGGAVGRRGSWEYYERKNTTLDDSQMLNNKQDPKEYLT